MTDMLHVVLAVAVLCSVTSRVFLQEVHPTECRFDEDGDYDCRNCSLTGVPEYWPANTTVILLDHNNLSILRNEELLNKGALNYLKLLIRNNDIAELEDGAFSGLTNLNVLGLGSNKLTVFSKDIVSHNLNLVEMFMENNPITLPSSEDVSLLNSVSLTAISLSMCNLTRLTRGLFSETPNIKTLYLTFNGFTTVHWEAVKHLNLVTFDLEGNLLQHVPLDTDMVQSLSNLNNEVDEYTSVNPTNTSIQGGQLSTIDLTHNPLVCDCNMDLAIYAMKVRFSDLFGTCKDADDKVQHIGGLDKVLLLKQCFVTFMETYEGAAK